MCERERVCVCEREREIERESEEKEREREKAHRGWSCQATELERERECWVIESQQCPTRPVYVRHDSRPNSQLLPRRQNHVAITTTNAATEYCAVKTKELSH